jgi:flagellar M-ring protein FliF
LDLKESGEIDKVLKEKSIPFKLEDESRTILVPKGKVHSTRLELASRGLPRGGSIGFEIFDKTNIGLTEFTEHLQYLRALQGELERTISTLSQVESVRVHLALPKKSVFLEEREEPKATVVIKLKPGADLGKKEVKAIVHLVANSVEGLKPNNVTVVDTQGRDLTELVRGDEELEGGVDRAEFKHKLEKAMEKKLNSVLTSILGPGRAIATVSLDVDFSKVERMQEAFDPESIAVRSEDITNESVRGVVPQAGGVPGTESNLGPLEILYSQSNMSSDKRRMIRNYEISKVVEKIQVPPGVIKRLSVSVMVDGIYEKQGDKEVYKPLSPSDLEAIKRAVMAAVGYNQERGDVVEVVNVQFRNNELKSYQEEMKKMEEREFIYSLIKYGTFFIFMLFFLFLVIRPLVKYLLGMTPTKGVREEKAEVEEKLGTIGHVSEYMKERKESPVSSMRHEATMEVESGLLEEREISVEEVAKEVFGEGVLEGLKTEKAKAKAMLRQVREWIEKNPSVAAKLIETWVEEGM